MRSMTVEGVDAAAAVQSMKEKRRDRLIAALTPLIRAPSAPTFSHKGRRVHYPQGRKCFDSLSPWL